MLDKIKITERNDIVHNDLSWRLILCKSTQGHSLLDHAIKNQLEMAIKV